MAPPVISQILSSTIVYKYSTLKIYNFHHEYNQSYAKLTLLVARITNAKNRNRINRQVLQLWLKSNRSGSITFHPYRRLSHRHVPFVVHGSPA